MPHPDTAEVIRRFNAVFLEHEPAGLNDLIADDCVLESSRPAPDGVRYEGYRECLDFWRGLASDPTSSFDLEDVIVTGDRATIRWRFRPGGPDNEPIRGVNLIHVRDGKVVEALGYVKGA
jgi:ketosteroid isomerase-like protein